MTNAEIADVLSADIGLSGRDAVTSNIVRQWVAWDVLPKATALGETIGRGPTWTRGALGFRRATRLAKLRKLGVIREAAVIAQSYLEWGHPDFERVRTAMLGEVKKWRAQALKRHTTIIGDVQYKDLSSVSKRALRNQLGPLDTRLSGTQYEQSGELYAVMLHLMRLGAGNSQYLQALISSGLKNTSGQENFIPAELFQIIVDCFSGLFGSADEIDNSVESALQSATIRQFRLARHFWRQFHDVLRSGTSQDMAILSPDIQEMIAMLNLLGPQISVGPWAIFAFCVFLNLAVKYPNFGQELGKFRSEFTPLLLKV